MVSVPMRAKFNDAVAAAGDEPHSFPMDVHVQEKLVDARMAVMHAFIDAYRRYVDAGETFGELPRGCLELRSDIASDCDVRLDVIARFVGEHVAFELTRQPNQRGLKVLGYLKRDDLIKRIRATEGVSSVFKDVKATAMKDLVTSVMATKRVKLNVKTTVEGETVYNVFLGCEWSSGVEE